MLHYVLSDRLLIRFIHSQKIVIIKKKKCLSLLRGETLRDIDVKHWRLPRLKSGLIGTRVRLAIMHTTWQLFRRPSGTIDERKSDILRLFRRLLEHYRREKEELPEVLKLHTTSVKLLWKNVPSIVVVLPKGIIQYIITQYTRIYLHPGHVYSRTYDKDKTQLFS